MVYSELLCVPYRGLTAVSGLGGGGLGRGVKAGDDWEVSGMTGEWVG